ncbi:hypothetical protein [Nonomuraea helvata]|uniref:Uncharacterized protein n=1 Tax=Nonomuraea helvata TaxID=37484 RepID=A0ABV5SDN6_9ACTN
MDFSSVQAFGADGRAAITSLIFTDCHRCGVRSTPSRRGAAGRRVVGALWRCCRMRRRCPGVRLCRRETSSSVTLREGGSRDVVSARRTALHPGRRVVAPGRLLALTCLSFLSRFLLCRMAVVAGRANTRRRGDVKDGTSRPRRGSGRACGSSGVIRRRRP